MFEIKETKHLHPMNVALSDGTTGWFLYEYSRGLCEDMSLPMKEGVWLTEWADGVDVRTSEFIPIVVRQGGAKPSATASATSSTPAWSIAPSPL